MRGKPMSKLHFLCILFIFLLNPLIASSVSFSVERAIAHAKKLKAQGLEIQIYQKYEATAKANYQPIVNFNVYQKSEKTEFTTRKSSVQNSSNFSLSLKQNIYNGAYDKYNIQMAQKDIALAQMEYEKINQSIIYEALSIHLAVFLAKERLYGQRKLLGEYNTLLKIAEYKAEYGDENEKNELISRKYSASMKKLSLQEDYALKKAQYLEYTGSYVKSLKMDLNMKKNLIPPPSYARLEQSNWDILKNILELSKVKDEINRDKSLFLPKIDLELQAYKAEPLAQLAYATENQYSAKLNLSYNFYNGKRDKLKSEITQLRKLQLLRQGDDIYRDVSLKYSEYYIQYKHSLKTNNLLANYLKTERKKYFQYKKIFKLSGAKSLLDILGVLENIEYLKNMKYANIEKKVMTYTNMLFLQSKLSLVNIQ